MVPFFSTGFFKGPVAQALGGADISMLVGLPVAAGAYYLLCSSLDLQEDRRRALAADRDLEPGLPRDMGTAP
jgi:purine-cytosine permease-like protein